MKNIFLFQLVWTIICHLRIAVYIWATWCTFRPKAQKNIKFLIFFFKNVFFLYFGKWNFAASSLKNLLYFYKKIILIFRGWNFSVTSLKNKKKPLYRNILEVFPTFQDDCWSSRKIKKSLVLWDETKKTKKTKFSKVKIIFIISQSCTKTNCKKSSFFCFSRNIQYFIFQLMCLIFYIWHGNYFS